MTLEEARAWLRGRVEEGARCPCCNQLAKVYKRPINSAMAWSLITMYRSAGMDWQHTPTTLGRNDGEPGKLRYWRLIDEELERREDGGRAGWWRVTPEGEAWLLDRVRVPKYAYIYDSKLLRLDGPATDIRTALGTKFDYNELMGRETFWGQP